MSTKIDNLIAEFKTLTLLEAAELVSEIERVFGVDTSVSVASVGAVVSAPVAVAAEVVEEKTQFDVVLDSVPADKKLLF